MTLKYKNIIPAFLLLCLTGGIFGQWNEEDEKPSFRDRIFVGGNFGIQLGTYTNIDLSPLVGFRVTPRFAAGTGLRFEYFKYKYYHYETIIYGSSLFSRYTIIQNLGEGMNIGINTGIFLQAEYEVLSLERQYFEPFSTDPGRFIVHSVFAGGGVMQPIGSRSAVLITILYNLNESASSPYSNPIIRFGFIF